MVNLHKIHIDGTNMGKHEHDSSSGSSDGGNKINKIMKKLERMNIKIK